MVEKKEKNRALKSIVRGAGILFINAFLFFILRFLFRIVASRYLGPEGYGFLSIGEALINVAVLVSMLGLNQALSRFIPGYIKENKISDIKGTIISTLCISIGVSILLTVLLLFSSEYVANNFFKNVELSKLIFIFSLAIPFHVGVMILSKIYIAFKRPEFGLYTSTVFRTGTLLIITLLIVILGGTIVQISFSYLISAAVAFVIGFFFLDYFVFSIIRNVVKPTYQVNKLVRYAFPLFLTGVFVSIMGYADTFILGFFRSEAEVGVYNIALPMATSFGIFLTSFSHIFFPVASELVTLKKVTEIKRIYSIIARWIFLLSLPFAILFVFFSGSIIFYLFGEDYLSGTFALSILVLGYFVNIITGPAVDVLKVFDKLKFIFYFNLVIVISNIILNIFLIPKYGLNGAAVATAITLAAREIILFIKAKKCINFTYQLKYYFKYLLAAIISIVGTYFVYTKFLNIFSVVHSLLMLSLFFFIYFALIIIFRAISSDEIMLIFALEKKFQVDLSSVRKFLDKFKSS